MKGRYAEKQRDCFAMLAMTWFAFCVLNFAIFAAISYAASLNIPEKLVYDLTWAGIKAGTASLELINDGDRIKIISTARSARWVSVFYRVDDRVESTLVKNENNPPQTSPPPHSNKKNPPQIFPLPPLEKEKSPHPPFTKGGMGGIIR